MSREQVVKSKEGVGCWGEGAGKVIKTVAGCEFRVHKSSAPPQVF